VARWKPWKDLIVSFHTEINAAYRRIIRAALMEESYGRHRQAPAASHGNPVAPPFAQQSPGVPLTAPGFSFPPTGVTTTAPPPEQEPITHAGIRAGEIVAYRGWMLHPNGNLRSVHRDDEWEPGIPMQGNPDEPYAGVHAYKSILGIAEYGLSSRIYSIDSVDPMVTGTVELWGTVIEHERGYRAEYAAISSIHDSPDYDADELRKRYGLDKPKRKSVNIKRYNQQAGKGDDGKGKD